jgi:cell division protein FtsI/penicillin-binding protein 2
LGERPFGNIRIGDQQSPGRGAVESILEALGAYHRQYGSFEQGGTAALSQLVGIDFAGKTGTAEGVNHGSRSQEPWRRNERANTWFVGMAPRRNSDVAVVVLREHWG